MWCVKCQNDFPKCTCEDLEERLDAAVKGGGFVYRKCRKCGKHYERCECAVPNWNNEGA